MSSINDDAFQRDLDKAWEHMQAERVDESIALCRSMLAGDSCPPYHKIKSLIMLANMVEDWEEANDCWTRGEAAWQIARTHLPRNTTTAAKDIEEAFAELRADLDELRQSIDEDEDAPEDVFTREDPESIVAGLVTQHFEAVEQAGKARVVVEGSEEEQLAADAKALNTTTEALGKLDVRKSMRSMGNLTDTLHRLRKQLCD